MSLSYSKKDSFKSALKDKYIRNFDYNAFENITRIASGAFGTVHRANSTNLEKHVALKSLHENENGKLFYEKFVRELTNILSVNNHKNIINFYGITIDPKTGTHYLVLQYAKDGDLRTYLQNNFKILDWKIKINMAKDITSGLRCIHKENIVHKDLHSKNILVDEGRLLITDLGLSQPLDSNSNSMAGGMIAYTDPKYLRNQMKYESYKRNKASDIYSLGVLFWELSSGRPPFYKIQDLGILNLVISGEREKPINETPVDYINIYSSAWEDDPNERPTIENIFDSLENIKLENIYYDSNDNQYIQSEAYINQASINDFGRDFISNASSFTTSGEFTGNQIIKYNYNDFKNLKNIGNGALGMIYSATLMNGERKVALKPIVTMATTELFVNELKQYSHASSHENIIRFFGISQKNSKRNEYILVLEYANGGTLREHLKSNFKKLEWSDKLNIARQIVKAIEHLHSNDIVHGDLHSKNILLHDNTIKISDFGIAKLNTKNTIEYSEPILLEILDKFSTKTSDIFSIGILLWEISSGKVPYESKFQDELDLKIYVSQGTREDPIIGTPQDYIKIYQECWNQDPNQRPNIGKVMQDLEYVLPARIISNPELSSRVNEPFSTIINKEHVAEILTWINRKSATYSLENIPNEIRLILRGSKSGFHPKTFWNMCNGYAGTIVVAKIAGTDEIVGGYNPLAWDNSIGDSQMETNDSFIFSLKNGNIQNSILSRVKNQKGALLYCNSDDQNAYGPWFGDGEFVMESDIYDFAQDKHCWCYYANYEKPIRTTHENFSIIDYEESRQDNICDNETSGLYLICINIKTLVFLQNTEFIITTVQGCNDFLQQPGYICKVKNTISNIFDNPSAAITTLYQQLFGSKTRFSGSFIMGHDKTEINKQLLTSVTFCLFHCLNGNLWLFVFGIGISDKEQFYYAGVVQAIFQKLQEPKCKPEEWYITEKMQILWNYHLQKFTLASIQWNQFFISWYNEQKSIIELITSLKKLYPPNYIFKEREMRACISHWIY
ncbi:hypothetical protein Glove_165g3 [Diversispora epigaea]|uniref:Protein kinase domain-containing protein n=1 Tax=Diversispora epigaea TaxID=1348612 RepID=A0A397IZW2_9GLOM|nr:hypothetical protein Glove_165g3 [Diversispora epigaea]